MDTTKKPPVDDLPWFLEMFLYPTSTAGLINLFIYWILPIALGLIARLMPISFVLAGVNLVIAGSLFYYLMQCIRESASGGTRAPDNLTNLPDVSDAIAQIMEIVACVALFWGPVGFYFIFTRKTDIIFWPLLGYGVFFFPMGFLALAMFNTTSAFNPFLWISSIFSTFFHYCGLVLFFCLLAWLFGQIASVFPQSLLLAHLYGALFIYLSMVACHLLGRFYYLNSKKLNWEV